MVKLGLATASLEPNPAAKPLTKVVLPPPRSLMSSITSPPRSLAPMERPHSMVCSGETECFVHSGIPLVCHEPVIRQKDFADHPATGCQARARCYLAEPAFY